MVSTGNQGFRHIQRNAAGAQITHSRHGKVVASDEKQRYGTFPGFMILFQNLINFSSVVIHSFIV